MNIKRLSVSITCAAAGVLMAHLANAGEIGKHCNTIGQYTSTGNDVALCLDYQWKDIKKLARVEVVVRAIDKRTDGSTSDTEMRRTTGYVGDDQVPSPQSAKAAIAKGLPDVDVAVISLKGDVARVQFVIAGGTGNVTSLERDIHLGVRTLVAERDGTQFTIIVNKIPA